MHGCVGGGVWVASESEKNGKEGWGGWGVEGGVSWGEDVRTQVKVQGGIACTASRDINAMINARGQEGGGQAFLSGPGGGQRGR